MVRAMTDECENLATCGFFKKYYLVNRQACRAFIKEYCRGEIRESCVRRAYRKANGHPPPDDMLPNGVMLEQ